MQSTTRRDVLTASGRVAGTAVLGLPLVECIAGSAQAPTVQTPRKVIDEYDANNTKVGHIVPATLGDEDILFLKQIGLRTVLLTFDPAEATLEKMKLAQERFDRHDIKIFGGLNHIYRSLKIQLG